MPIKVGTTSIKIPFSKAYVGSSLVYTSAQPSIYDYGDGSLNTTARSYEGLVYLNGYLPYNVTRTYNYGNYVIPFDDRVAYSSEIIIEMIAHADVNTSATKTYILAGTQLYSMPFDATNEEKTIAIRITGGGGSSSVYISDLKFNCDGTLYTLQEMVTNGCIKPLVLMASMGNNNNYCWQYVFKLYDNSGNTGTKSYPEFGLIFMLNKGHNITQMQMYANRAFSTRYDGISYIMCPTNDVRLTLNAY